MAIRTAIDELCEILRQRNVDPRAFEPMKVFNRLSHADRTRLDVRISEWFSERVSAQLSIFETGQNSLNFGLPILTDKQLMKMGHIHGAPLDTTVLKLTSLSRTAVILTPQQEW